MGALVARSIVHFREKTKQNKHDSELATINALIIVIIYFNFFLPLVCTWRNAPESLRSLYSFIEEGRPSHGHQSRSILGVRSTFAIHIT